jgi:hypothetical protein
MHKSVHQRKTSATPFTEKTQNRYRLFLVFRQDISLVRDSIATDDFHEGHPQNIDIQQQ